MTTAKAMAAFGLGKHQEAADLMVSVLDERQCLGGSSEQLDVLEEVGTHGYRTHTVALMMW